MSESRRATVTALGLLAAALLFSGCAQLLGAKPEIRQKRRYTLAAEPVRQTFGGSLRPYAATVQLELFSIAGHLDQLEIITRSSPYEFRRDPLRVWGVRPREMVTYVVGEYLRDSQLFTRLVLDRELLDERPDFVITGHIGALERFDSGDRWFARLQLAMQLVRERDGAVLWRGTIGPADELEVFGADMQYTVQALSEILRRKMESFVRELDGVFMRVAAAPEAVPAAGALPDTAAAAVGPPGGAVPASASPDTAAGATPAYYRILPGKLAP